jgi:hypothetical protein
MFRKNYFPELIRHFCTVVNLTLISRKHLPGISGSEFSALTSHGVGSLFDGQITAGQLANNCQSWIMSNSCIWQDGIPADDATVRMRLEIRRRDNPFAKGTSCHTIEG